MEHADTTADVQERRCGWEVRLQPAEQERSSREWSSPTVAAEISCGPFRPELLVEHLRPTTAHCALHDGRPVRLTKCKSAAGHHLHARASPRSTGCARRPVPERSAAAFGLSAAFAG